MTDSVERAGVFAYDGSLRLIVPEVNRTHPLYQALSGKGGVR